MNTPISMRQAAKALALAFAATVAASALAGEAALEPAPQQWALLAGIDDYAELPDNRHCAEDVRTLHSRLIACGFAAGNVFVLHGGAAQPKYLPSKANLERQLDVVPRLPGSQDALIFVFSGHALRIEGRIYLCPLEARPAAPHDTLVPWDDVLQQLARSPAAHKLVVLDLVQSVPAGQAAPGDGLWNDFPALPNDVTMLANSFSNASSPAREDADDRRFLRMFAHGLEGAADRTAGNNDGKTALSELIAYVRRAAQAANGGPPVQAPAVLSELTDDWILGAVPPYPAIESRWPAPVDNADSLPTDLESLAAISPASLRALNRAWNFLSFAYGGDQAIADANDAIRLDPNNRWAYVIRGFHYRKMGALDKALADFRKLGIPLPCFVYSGEAELKLGDTTVATLYRGDMVYVTKANGDWFWVEGAGKADGKKGWVHGKHIE